MSATNDTSSVPGSAPAAAVAPSKRRVLLIGTTALLLLALAGYGVWWLIYASHYEDTDDAYVAGNVVQVTPQIGGTVVAINIDDTELVQAGAPLIKLDQADAQVALKQAEAQLAQTVREVRTLFTNNGTLAANVAVREGDLQRARADLARRQELIATGAVSLEEVAHARSALQSAESALLATREQLASNRALTDNTTIARHPNVQRAAAQLRAAYLDHARTELPAPITGYVAKRSVQIGQRVAAGTPLLSIVPLDSLWVDANFKEVQIAHMRIGQPVTLHADSVRLRRRLSRQGGGSGGRHRLGLCAAAGAECERQLDQDRTADSGPHLARSEGTGHASAAHRPVDAGQGEYRTHRRQFADRQRRAARRSRLSNRRVRGRRAPGRRPDRPHHCRECGTRQAVRAIRTALAPTPATQRTGLFSMSATPPPAALPPLHGPQLVLGTLVLSLAVFMNVLDTSIANVSIPAIAGDLGVSPQQGTWVITSFAVANAISVPLTGWLTQRIGQVRLFVGAILLFVLASALCGMAPSIEFLIAARVLQGAVAGPMIPLSQTLLLASYPPAKSGMALAFWGMTTLVAPIIGPLLGGWISDNYSWPWIFYINIPIGMLAAWATWAIYHKRESATKRLPIDKIGLALLVLWVGALQLMLDKGKELDWFSSTEIIVLAAVAVVGFIYFIIWELGDAHPVVDLSLFKGRNFSAGVVAISVGYGVFFGSLVILPLWLQTQLELHRDRGRHDHGAGRHSCHPDVAAGRQTVAEGRRAHHHHHGVRGLRAGVLHARPVHARGRFHDADDPDHHPGRGDGDVFHSADLDHPVRPSRRTG